MKWHVINGKTNSYAVSTGKRPEQKKFYMHRVIMGVENNNGVDVDHINGNSLDNRRCNLRVCTRSQNTMNKRKHKDGIQKYKGITFRKDNQKYQAQIMLNGKRITIGCFDTDIEAAKAYDNFARRYFGEFAKTNF